MIMFGLYYYASTALSTTEKNFKNDATEKGDGHKQEIKNPEPREVGKYLTKEITYSINASSPEEWVYFDFSRGTVVDVPAQSSPDWDIGFRRAGIISNGGETNPDGLGGIIEIRGVGFEAVKEAPESGYTVDIRIGSEETENPVIKKWYEYSYWTHILKPKNNVYIIRTADGRYAKMQILGYYCGRLSGCYTIRYVYQGNRGRKFY